MAITWNKFLECVNHFLSVSNSIDDGWLLINKKNLDQLPGNCYLLKKDIKPVGKTKRFPLEHSSFECEGIFNCDSSCVQISELNETAKLVWEYHILYSPSYSVPVLYFNVTNTAGKLLPLEEIWAVLNIPEQVLLEKWSFVTQQEHPILLRPFFVLHPCKSVELLKVCENSKINPLVTWLSSIAHIVHLSVPQDYGREVDQNLPSLGKLSFPTSLIELKDLATLLSSYYKQNSYYVVVLFCSAYLYKQAFIIPGSVFMNVLAGALFGVLKGFPLCCVLTASGATACYLMSRAFGSSVLMRYFPSQIKFLQEKVDQNSDRLIYYLLFLRLFPMSPNWLINLLSPIVGIPLHIFFITVLIGLMPYNFLCVQAGGMLATLRSMDDVLSFTTLLQLAAMAVVALGPSFILKKKQSFRDSFNIPSSPESKKSL